ncbi:hypothetical protein COO60DRAFT_840226 [Scenedesmus sp. NREL 46B-D3]|nr:hypothetical protein COO60DRAFT_840226 [Scenedesmus sp. NREL 46B-D3]
MWSPAACTGGPAAGQILMRLWRMPAGPAAAYSCTLTMPAVASEHAAACSQNFMQGGAPSQRRARWSTAVLLRAWRMQRMQSACVPASSLEEYLCSAGVLQLTGSKLALGCRVLL